ncbi:MAG: HD domain-containing protein [Candidatus Melainabacteria bacterium]|jgi:response regulator RpfG family c-di-GMP phosphodiesterase|nr:HD domain-containing protein [Candidatus Melainabacteria bacterium]OPZ91424.1 MAG: Cyclic di-GMP phosphodiesterase response regulator RpfG [bacterium ADurb.Bin425]
MRRHKILVVDDEVPNLRLLRRVLSEDHDIFEATGGKEGLEILEKESISLIITDQRMPSMTGVQLLEQSLTLRPDAIKILLTGYTDVQALIDAINAGHVYKYIPKPWDADELKLTVRRALEAYELKENNDNLVVELRAALSELESLSVGTIRALADALDAKCDYTAGHSLRVSRIAVLIGRQLALPDDMLRDVELGGILHDIGKIGVPESILWKPDKLTPEERSIMSRHPVKSAEIIGDLKGLVRAREYVKHHHEYFDGSGYPDGLKGEDIPIGARIILVSDAYDAMTTDRPYRKAIGHERAIQELRKLRDTQFDPNVVDALLALTEDGGKEMDKVIKEQFDESFIGLTLASVDPAKTGKQYREEAERRARLANS